MYEYKKDTSQSTADFPLRNNPFESFEAMFQRVNVYARII
jgi:hypothetical protein